MPILNTVRKESYIYVFISAYCLTERWCVIGPFKSPNTSNIQIHTRIYNNKFFNILCIYVLEPYLQNLSTYDGTSLLRCFPCDMMGLWAVHAPTES